MTKHLTTHLFLTMATCLTLAACGGDGEVDAQTSAHESAATVVCTPGESTCDYGCFFQGGPSSSDCIIKCNATGTAWLTIEDCGWAQNFPFSSSCLPSQPRPVCENN